MALKTALFKFTPTQTASLYGTAESTDITTTHYMGNCRCSTQSNVVREARPQRNKPLKQVSLGLCQLAKKKIVSPNLKCYDSETSIKSSSLRVFPHFMFYFNDSKSVIILVFNCCHVWFSSVLYSHPLLPMEF
jgi:hypothetical protein